MKGIPKDKGRELFEEITQQLMQEDKPSDYILRLSKEEIFKEYPLTLLQKLKTTEQSIKYHPEGSVWNHTMLVLDEAAKVREQCKDAKVFLWAALLHDIGKPGTTRMRKGRITSYDHDIEGAKVATEFLHSFTDDEDFIRKVSYLVKYHMHMLYVLKNLPHGDVKNLLNQVDIDEIALLCRCDRLGRLGVDREAEEKDYRDFISVLKQKG